MRLLGVLLCATLAAGCTGRRKPPPRPTPADYTPPVWDVRLAADPGTGSGLTAALVSETMSRTAGRILDYWRAWSGGMYRPPEMPHGSVPVDIYVERTCSTSGEMPGRGAYGMILKGWSCTKDAAIALETLQSWICHRLAHVVGGFGSGGNALHQKIAEVCGC